MSVYKRGGVYWYDFWFRGVRYRESTGLSNKTAATDAEAIRRAELAEGRAGIVHRGPSPKLKEFVAEEFLPWSEREHQAHPRTHLRHKVSSKPLTAFFGKLPIDAISPADVEKFKAERSRDISSAGVNRDLASLRYMLNFAVRQGHSHRNPVIGVRFLAEGPGVMRIISHEEQTRYLAEANPLLRDVATMMLETGMRPEEVFTIRKENVHLGRRHLFVPVGKTKFARRNVPLTDNTAAILRRRLAKAKGPYLFPHRHDPNRPLTSMKTAHDDALSEAKIEPRFRLYDLRHTFGSRSAMAGVDLATLKELMGHSNISITMRYVHPTPEHKQEAIRKLVAFNNSQCLKRKRGNRRSPQKSPQLALFKFANVCKLLK